LPNESFYDLYNIVVRLRSENGCAWDRKQTPETMLPNLIEEAYELVEAVHDKDNEHIKEELGDLFLLVTMIGYMMEQENKFQLTEVFSSICDKLIRRHPHVFGKTDLTDPESIIHQWNKIKKEVEGRDSTEYITDSIPKSLPPLERAYKMQKKAAQQGFDWNEIKDVFGKLREEIDELEAEVEAKEPADGKRIEEELGDLLFAVVNISRFAGFDPSVALHKGNEKFIKRFSFIQDRFRELGLELSADNFGKMEEYWNMAKNNIKDNT
jgi:tetrapyrrole methylase family protein/MazG family protein